MLTRCQQLHAEVVSQARSSFRLEQLLGHERLNLLDARSQPAGHEAGGLDRRDRLWQEPLLRRAAEACATDRLRPDRTRCGEEGVHDLSMAMHNVTHAHRLHVAGSVPATQRARNAQGACSNNDSFGGRAANVVMHSYTCHNTTQLMRRPAVVSQNMHAQA